MSKSTSAAIAASMMLAGCTSTIHTTSKLGNTDVLSLDAKQRVILNHNGKICAEPSPDALVAQAAAVAAAANGVAPSGQQLNGKLAASLSESAASLAQRTQAIQLMRDGYYRICEAYLNGAIRPQEYRKIVNGIDEFMIALIGIEAIGGTQNVPPVTIGAQGNAKIVKEDGTVTTVPILGVDQRPGATTSATTKEQAQAIKSIVIAYLRRKNLRRYVRTRRANRNYRHTHSHSHWRK